MMNPVLLKEDNKRHQGYYPNRLVRVLIYIYIIISFYEGYLNQIIGAYTRYYIFLLIFVLVFSYKKIKITNVHWMMIFWLGFKFFSIIWGQGSPYQSGNVSTHLYAHLGMVGLFIAMTLVSYNEKFIKNVVNLSMYTSFSMAVLGLFFSQPYHQTVESRRVLTIFGNQVDPNNLAAFYLVGYSIALYYFVYERKNKLRHLIIVLLSALVIAFTGSRGGLVSALVIVLIVVFSSGSNRLNLLKVIKNFAIITILLWVTYIIISYSLPSTAYERLFVFDDYSSGSGRDILWNTSKILFMEKPLLGWGWGGTPPSLHNTYITMLVEIGLIGTVLFFIPIIKVIFYSLKKNSPLSIVILFAGLGPSFFIDGINKRFFWNAIIVAIILLNCFVENTVNDNK